MDDCRCQPGSPHIFAENGGKAVKDAFLFAGSGFFLFRIYLFRPFTLLCLICCGQRQKPLMADCPVDTFRLNPFENPVKFCNPLLFRWQKKGGRSKCAAAAPFILFRPANSL